MIALRILMEGRDPAMDLAPVFGEVRSPGRGATARGGRLGRPGWGEEPPPACAWPSRAACPSGVGLVCREAASRGRKGSPPGGGGMKSDLRAIGWVVVGSGVGCGSEASSRLAAAAFLGA